VKVSTTPFEGLLVIDPRIFSDSRGHFWEAYNMKSFREAGIEMEFVQDNQSHSTKGTLRGMHFQKPPHAQTKLVRVLTGEIQDVVIDLRKDSPTFGKHHSIRLSAENKKQFLIPKGFAHGFLVLSETADVLYKCDDFYHPEAESGVQYDDPFFNIKWQLPVAELNISDKDLKYSPYKPS
jgi:dTDP-4-dehydrorhamnose 3,5-epimerase